jgi:acetyl esterase/lipase
MSFRAVLLACLCLVFSLAGTGEQTHPNRGYLASKVFPPAADLRVLRDLEYARYGDRVLRLDLYLPPQPSSRPIPGIVVIRGGGWRQGDKNWFAFIAGYLAKAGFAAACIEYRASSEARFPAAIQDAKAAVRWLRANATRYGIDPDALGAIGGSAGAHLAAMLATSHQALDLEGAGGNASMSSRVQAVVGMATTADLGDGSTVPHHTSIAAFIGSPLEGFADARRRASPITYVTREAAPILLIHSSFDGTVPYMQSVLLEQRYKESGARAELVTIPDAPHDFWNYTRWFPEAMERAVKFFGQNLVPAAS